MKNSGKNTTLEKVIEKNYLELSGQGFKEHYNLRLSFIQLTLALRNQTIPPRKKIFYKERTVGRNDDFFKEKGTKHVFFYIYLPKIF